ncbi:MAG: cytochrome-c oxidase, cbb3-type subunit III [Kiloniellales bacterium]
MAGTPEKDEISGVNTTGHVWDGIRELDNPLPRWWIIVFYLTIIWAVIYIILMPAIPLFNSFTHGVLDWSSRASLERTMEQAAAEQKPYMEKISGESLEQIQKDPELAGFVQAGGRSAFAVNCSQCHGQGAQGGPGYPNLNDDGWIWGGTLEDIYQTIKYGIRNAHLDSRQNIMMAYGKDDILSREEIRQVAEYVLSLSGRSENAEMVSAGKEIFEAQCVSCHQDGGIGDTTLGAPNLTDAIWLYGGSREAIIESLTYGRAGMMPPWEGRLSDDTIKLLTVYVHSLGGGQ